MLDKELMQSVYSDIEKIRENLLQVRDRLSADEPRYKSLLNLNQYLELRSEDWTKLQEKLFLLSLSSLGRSYAHVSASIDRLHDQLCCALGYEEISQELLDAFHHLTIEDSIEIASKNGVNLFGGRASSRLSKQSTSLMITLPSNAMDDDAALIKKLASSKVSIFRINTAHDDASTWRAMGETILKINESRGDKEKLKLFVDLAGPKIRTAKIRKVDMPIVIGSNKVEKELLIYHDERETKAQRKDRQTLQKLPAEIVVSSKFFKSIQSDKRIKVTDINAKKAKIRVIEKNDEYALCKIDKKVFLDEKSSLRVGKKESTLLNIVPQTDQIRLFVDDEIIITQEDILGSSATLDKDGTILKPAIISATHKQILKDVVVGDKLFIDDGKIGLEVVQKGENEILCRVRIAKANGTLIKEEKGINLPDTYIRTSALTQEDRENLQSVIDIADSVSISFCQTAKDVQEIQKLLAKYGREDIGIIAKIETKQAVLNMPQILTQLLKSQNSGVMIARGDLAIEVGFENLAQIQESLLDICDAAHIPVIWATQVLESKMKNNLPSRAEVTDAAMSSRAECVMLNKGPFAFDTISVLTSILHEMHKKFKKNKQLLKKETFWECSLEKK